jgi:hypothetical protein
MAREKRFSVRPPDREISASSPSRSSDDLITTMYEPSDSSWSALAMLATGSDTNNVAVRADTSKRFILLTLMSKMFSHSINR